MPPVCVIAAARRIMMESSRDVLQHLIQANYNSLALAAVTLQTLTRQSKTPTAWFSHSRLLVFKNLQAWCKKMASVLESHHCSETATASRKKDSHSWNHVRNLPWPMLAKTYNTPPGLASSLLISKEICSLFYSYPKVVAYVNAIILAARWPSAPLRSHQVHINCTLTMWMPPVCQRQKVVTLKHHARVAGSQREGCKRRLEPHQAGSAGLKRKPSVYLLWYFCRITW